VPAFIVLVVYALFPIVNNTVAGLKLLDENVLDTAKGMGMSKSQAFFRVELPLAFPVILGGIRTAMTQSIGNTILAGLIGGGGLGSIIFLGLAQSAPDLILLGVIPILLISLASNDMFSFFINFYSRRILGAKQYDKA
jgi:osmoprotectant transport system permease protein